MPQTGSLVARRLRPPPGVAATALCGCLLFGIFLIWSLSTARYGGPDEPAHILRAAAVADGDLLGSPAPGLDPGYRSVLVPAALTTGDPSCYRHDADEPATCGVADPAAAGRARAASSAGTYPPLYYALVGVPVRLLGDQSDVSWYRIVSAMWCAAVLAIAWARAGRFGPWLLGVGLTPAAWFLFGVVNPNALEICLSVLGWVGVERIRSSGRALTVADAAWIAAPMAVAIVIRPVAALAWLGMAGALVTTVRGRASTSTSTSTATSTAISTSRRPVAVLLGVPIAAVLAAIGWNVYASVDVSDSRTAERVSIAHALGRAIDGSTETWREMAGSLGWLEFSAPWIAHLAWWAIVAIAIWLAVTAEAPLRWAYAWTLAVVVISPVAFEVAFAGSVGFIWQGRYSIPTGVGLVILGLSEWSRRLPRRVAGTAVAITAVAQVITLWVVLRRYTVGDDGSLLFAGSAWHPPLEPVILLVADVALVAALWRLSASAGAFGDLAPDDVERRTSLEPLDLLRAEGVHAFEIDR